MKVTILVFTVAPGRKELQAIFGTTSQTGYLLLFFSVRKKNTALCKRRQGGLKSVMSVVYTGYLL